MKKTRSRTTASKLPFHVPAPVEKALKNAGTRFDALTVKAKSVAAETEKQVKVAARDAQVRVRKAGAEVARRAEGVAKNVTETVGTAVEKGLHTLNVPTRKELRSLSAKVDGLGKKIEAFKSRKAPRTTRATQTKRRAR